MKHYFAADGNYGDAQDCIIADTEQFSDADWDDIANASDSSRLHVVGRIMDERGTDWANAEQLAQW